MAFEQALKEAERERTQGQEKSRSTLATEGEAEVVFNRGNASYDKKEYDQAISEYNEAIRLNLNNAKVYRQRGRAYYGKKEFDKAISDWTKSIRLDPNYSMVYNNRGNAYYDKKG